jgi:hypothetical protein
MNTENFMARYGERLLSNGYAILPIAPGTKKPGRHARGQWSDYPEWNRHAARPTTEIELKSWSRWPGCGIGIVGGAVAVVDIDIADDPALALEIEKLARELLGDTPAVRIGKAPKRMLVYRTTGPFKGIKRHPLEVLCLGQQFVAYAIHPDTGEPYAWPEEGLADIDIASLPEIDEAMARAFLEEAVAHLPESMRHVTLAGAGPAAIAPAHAQAGTMPAIRAALAFIPNAELDYDSWVRIGLALKGALGDAGEELFAFWSAQAAKNDDAFTARNWASFKPNTIGAGTIYHLAMERGWKPDAGLVLDGTATKADMHPATALLAKISAGVGSVAQASDTPRLVIPPAPALDRLDGALGLLVNHILVTAIRPQPWLAVGAALAALGSLMGRKVRTESNLRSNIYVLGIAESGGGKDHARKVIKEVFVQGGLTAHLGGERLASGAGLITALSRQPASLFQIDEFGKFVANVVDKRRAPKHLTEIWDLFTELATSAGTTFFGAEYADQRERPRQDIIEPCACIHGVSAPGPFWEALNGGALQDGSLARFLIFRSEEGIPDRNRQLGQGANIPGNLMDAILAVSEVGVPGAGNLARIGAPSTRPESLVVPMDDAARTIFDELDDVMTARQRAAIGTNQSAVLARVWENAAKVALIKAVSANPADPVIRAEDAVWARELVEHCAATLLVQAERHLANNDMERYHKQMLEFVREAGKEGIRHNDLTRKCQFIEPKLRREIIASLIEGEQICSKTVRSNGRSATLYCYCQSQTSNVHEASIDERLVPTH